MIEKEAWHRELSKVSGRAEDHSLRKLEQAYGTGFLSKREYLDQVRGISEERYRDLVKRLGDPDKPPQRGPLPRALQQGGRRNPVAKRVSDSFISEYRDIISRYDDMFSTLCDLEGKLSKKECNLWDGLSKESKDEVGKPIHYRSKLNAMQQWWSKNRPTGTANWPLTLPKDRKRAAQMIEAELEVMDKILKFGEKKLKGLEKKMLPEVQEQPEAESPPAPAFLPDMG